MRGVVVNRSMSQKELSILTLVSIHFSIPNFPGLALAYLMPWSSNYHTVQSQKCRLSEGSKLKLYEVNNDYIQNINDNLDPDVIY